MYTEEEKAKIVSLSEDLYKALQSQDEKSQQRIRKELEDIYLSKNIEADEKVKEFETLVQDLRKETEEASLKSKKLNKEELTSWISKFDKISKMSQAYMEELKERISQNKELGSLKDPLDEMTKQNRERIDELNKSLQAIKDKKKLK